MIYRTLGKTDMQVSVVGVGAWQFGGEWGRDYSQAEVNAVVDAALDNGITLIDTAECYGDHLSERLVGEATKGRRDRWIIATKFGHRFTERFERDQLWSPADVQKQLEDSLRSLQTDYVDLYQFHSGTDQQFDNEELWSMLARQVAAGKIRHLGISIGSNTNIYQTERAAAVGASTIQVVYNRLDRAPETAVFPSCVRQNLGILARVPLASGFLSGKYKPGATFGSTDVRSRKDSELVKRQLAEVDSILQNEVPAGVAPAAWALAWCLRREEVTCVIPGCKDPEQVAANAAAAELVATIADRA